MSNTTYYGSLEEIAGSTREGLGEWADEYDVDAIVAEAYEWECVTDDRDGDRWIVKEGFRMKDKYADEDTGFDAYWAMVEEHHIDTQDEDEEDSDPQDDPSYVVWCDLEDGGAEAIDQGLEGGGVASCL